MNSNLINSWLASQTLCGEPVTAALDGLNEYLGTDYTALHLDEWEMGRRSVPPNVQRYMLENCLHHVLMRHGFSPVSLEDDFYRSLADAILPPKPNDKK